MVFVYFESLFGGPDKFLLSMRFSFSIKGKGFFNIIFVCLFLLCVVFYP